MRVIVSVLVVVISWYVTASHAEVEMSKAPNQPETLTALWIGIAERESRMGLMMAQLAARSAIKNQTQQLAETHAEVYQARLTALDTIAKKHGIHLNSKTAEAGGIAPWVKADAFDETYIQRRLRAERYWVKLLRAGLQSDDASVVMWCRDHVAEAQKTLYGLQVLGEPHA